jgi:hypothetical protein
MQARGVSQPTTSSDMVIGPVHVVPAALSDYSVFSNTERPLAFMASIPSGEGASFHSVTFSHLRSSQGERDSSGPGARRGNSVLPGWMPGFECAPFIWSLLHWGPGREARRAWRTQ